MRAPWEAFDGEFPAIGVDELARGPDAGDGFAADVANEERRWQRNRQRDSDHG